MEDKINQFYEFIQNSKYTVFFGGAGVSTESGIPDFRSENGLYNKKNKDFGEFEPEYYFSRNCLLEHPKEFYGYLRAMKDTKTYEPNITHKVLAKMEEIGKLQAVITQNIDGLHQEAGSKKVIEIHGNSQSCMCDSCGMLYSKNYIYDSDCEIPTCKYCGGVIRPNITLYGEALPQDAILNATVEIRKADMLIIAGTSLSVYPAAGLVNFFRGKYIVVVNNSLLDIQTLPDTIFIESDLGKVFEKIGKKLENII